MAEAFGYEQQQYQQQQQHQYYSDSSHGQEVYTGSWQPNGFSLGGATPYLQPHIGQAAFDYFAAQQMDLQQQQQEQEYASDANVVVDHREWINE